MNFYVVVNYYLLSITVKFHEDLCINASTPIAHVLSRLRVFTTRACEDNIKNEDDLKMKTSSKIGPPLQNVFCPPPLKILPASPHDSHTTPDVKPEMITGL